MPITDKRVKSEKLGQHEKQKKVSDGGGLFLLLKANKNGLGKYWRMAYRFAGKQKELALGVYPSVSLKEARAKTCEAKKLLENNIDPNQQRKDDRRTAKEKVQKQNRDKEIDINTFEVVARKWFELQKPNWDDSYSCTVISRLERYMFPSLGSISIAKISKFQFSNAIEDITALGIADTAKRITQYTRNILEFAYDRGLINAIPLGQTKNLVPVRVKTPLPAITDTHEIGRLLKAIDAYTGTFTVCSALKVLPYLAVRSGEFRLAKWDEFDFKTRLWTIPAAHRKLSKVQKQDPENVHLVPLSKQAIKILLEIKKLTGSGRHVFPSARGDSRPMSENTINVALTTMGYKNIMVGHGFRTIFSTLLNEQGFNPDAIERQLAHKEANQVRAAYNRAEYIDVRTEMMQSWADCLEELKKNTILEMTDKTA